MSGASTLSNSVINLLLLREEEKADLCKVLDSVRGKKGLVLDPKLSGPLGLIAEVTVLKEHGVEKIYHLQPEKLNTEVDSLIYLIRPKVTFMRVIADQIRGHLAANERREYAIFFVPRSTMICEAVFKEQNLPVDVRMGDFHLDLIPFDNDVLSMEMDSGYRECFLDGDKSSLLYIARAIMRLQQLYGVIPHIKGKGTCAKIVVDMLLRMRRETMDYEEPKTPEIDSLIIIDRQVDMVTPVCTQLTYEGLIDEIFGIHNSYVDLDPDIIGPPPTPPGQQPQPQKKLPPGKKVKTVLNSNAKLYAEIRDLGFSVLGPLLNKKAKHIDEYYKKRYEAQTVNDLKDFVKRLPQFQSEHENLRLHTNIAEKVLAVTKEKDFHRRLEAEQSLLVGAGPEVSSEYIEECISRQEPLVKVLRLLILQSLTNNGLKTKDLEFFKREIIQSYGFHYLYTLNNLEKLGLLRRQEGRSGNFNAVRKGFRLIDEHIEENNPNDIGYVYAMYAPVSIRLVQYAFNPGWKPLGDVIKELPGPAFEEIQQLPAGAQEAPGQRNPVTLVFFIGGCTFTEISALRFLSQQEEGRRDYVIATTKLINGDTLLQTLFEATELNAVSSSSGTPTSPQGR
eukprot:TRINITY_DN372_c0_g1_i1.p1 TRINITY_DN372_c0_g1~~TRINITY_DN372_c0_g1_i1.p1  ORF type:complete len:619 (+),score=176.59 TRINITY_DN372_c0_g1_i1:181-2037(+)